MRAQWCGTQARGGSAGARQRREDGHSRAQTWETAWRPSLARHEARLDRRRALRAPLHSPHILGLPLACALIRVILLPTCVCTGGCHRARPPPHRAAADARRRCGTGAAARAADRSWSLLLRHGEGGLWAWGGRPVGDSDSASSELPLLRWHGARTAHKKRRVGCLGIGRRFTEVHSLHKCSGMAWSMLRAQRSSQHVHPQCCCRDPEPTATQLPSQSSSKR